MDLLFLILAVIFNLPIGFYAYKKHSLSVPGGIIAAGISGIILFLVQPIYWVLLIVFFSSSTLLTKFKENSEIKLEAMSLAEKGGERDMFQVLANAGIPLLFASFGIVSESILPITDLLAWYSVGIAISFAVVNADTWATELGVTSTTDPFWILNPTRRVPRGTSGGISSKGLIASLLGSVVIALVYHICLVLVNQVDYAIFFIILLGGMIGSLTDSLLGATVQAQYYCSSCDKHTESSYHTKCKTVTSHDRGLKWFSNDVVNSVAVLVSIAILLPFLW